MNDMTGKILGWVGIVVAVIGFFFAPVWLGIIGIVLGLVTLASPQKALAWIAVVVGAIVLIVHYFA